MRRPFDGHPRFATRGGHGPKGCGMAEAGSAVKEFFEAYVRATDSADSAFLRSAYGETFMFASPGAVQAVKRDDFLKVVPKRRAFFAAAGLAASDVRGLEETLLDEHHLLVKARWTFRFERDPARPIIEEGAATYILRRQDDRLQIVFQLDHQDLTKRVQELGLLPHQS
jgi:hypothetical protein